jgi:hypothetical protein
LPLELTFEQGKMMSNTDQNPPTGKPARRKGKGEQRRQKSEQPQGVAIDQALSPQPDRPESPASDQVEQAPVDTVAASATAAAIDPAAPTGPVPVSLRTIANAYGAYTLKSMEDTRSFVERLTGVRSLDKAMEVQSEFAKQAYATFVAETQKITDLHRELTGQTFKPLEGLVTRASKARN